MSIKYKDLAGQNTLLLNLYGDMNYNILPVEFSIAINKHVKKFSVMGDPMESINFIQGNNQFNTMDCRRCLTFLS